MGWMRHHAIIVTGGDWGETTIEDAHREARRMFGEVSPIMDGAANGYRTFMVPPDGSKEGWDTSEKCDGLRDVFIDWLEAQRYGDGSSPLDWVEVQYGDDGLETKVVRDSDAPRRRARRTRSEADGGEG